MNKIKRKNLTKNTTYDEAMELLPEELYPDDRAIKFKQNMSIYSELVDNGNLKVDKYGNLLDIMEVGGTILNLLGGMFSIYRDEGETDEDYRNRIITTNIARRTPVSLPEMQQAVNAVVTSGVLYVMENYNDTPANIYFTGTADDESITRATLLLSSFLPAGVGLIIAVSSFGLWSDVANQFSTWQTLKDGGYIW